MSDILWPNYALKNLSFLLPAEVYQAGRGTVGRHYNTTHPEIEKHYYTCKICTEYPPTASLVKIIEHFRKVSDF